MKQRLEWAEVNELWESSRDKTGDRWYGGGEVGFLQIITRTCNDF